MKIDDLIEKLQKARKTWKANLDIHIEVNEDKDCPTCGEPETYIYDGFPDRTGILSINSKPTFIITATKDSEREEE